MASIKNQIATGAEDHLKVLESAGTFMQTGRKGDIMVNVANIPACILVVGPEVPAQVEEDNVGYTMEFPMFFKIEVADHVELAATVDELAAKVETEIESDLTMGGLAVWVRYEGEVQFINEISPPRGGTVIKYNVQYRRLRGDPNTTY